MNKEKEFLKILTAYLDSPPGDKEKAVAALDEYTAKICRKTAVDFVLKVLGYGRISRLRRQYNMKYDTWKQIPNSD